MKQEWKFGRNIVSIKQWEHEVQASVCTSFSKFEFWQPCWWRQKIMPEEFDNGALFLPVDLPSTIIRHETELFENAFMVKLEEFENASFAF